MTTPSGVLHWKDYGGAGDLIVMVHGIGGTSANWDAVGPRFATLGRAVALDLPGFGLSPPFKDWELATHAMAVRQFISELGGPAILVGNSMGCVISEIVASQHPHLVQALVLISPATPPPTLRNNGVHWPTARRMLWQVTPAVGPTLTRRILEGHSPEDLVKLALQMITDHPGRVPMELVESFNQLARARQHLPWAAEATPATGRSIARLFRKRSRLVAIVRDIRAPTLVVHGLDDKIVSPAWVEWLCNLRPDWELVQMENTGHTPMMDSPVRLMGVVAGWLSRLREDVA